MKSAFRSLVLLMAVVGTAEADDGAAKELKSLSGAWRLVSVEDGGKAIPKNDLPAVSFTLGADGISTVRAPEGEFRTRTVVDPTKKPKAIEIEHLDGPSKGQKQYGVYKVDGGRWTVFSTPPGGKPEDRPKEFDSRTAKGGVVVWERVEGEKKR